MLWFEVERVSSVGKKLEKVTKCDARMDERVIYIISIRILSHEEFGLAAWGFRCRIQNLFHCRTVVLFV